MSESTPEQVSEVLEKVVEEAKVSQQASQLSIEQMTQQVGAVLDPAFPIVLSQNGRIGVVGGLSKREYFAAMAMQGILCGLSTVGTNADWLEKAMEHAKFAADALIKELSVPASKGQPSEPLSPDPCQAV